MPVGVDGFQRERLIQARRARGLTAISLADMAGLGQATISQYEKGTQKPRQQNLDKLAELLNVPPGFFLQPLVVAKPTRLFYRSMSAATKASRDRAEARYEWALEVMDYLLEFFDFPALNLPDIEIPENYRNIHPHQVEFIAEQLRSHWQLGDGPVANVVRTLESNGIVVWRTPFEAEKLDAFSEYRTPHPVVVLSADKQNYYRSRFDAAHELGHLILHRHVDRSHLMNRSDFNFLEQQAHRFAGAFLLPAMAYNKEVGGSLSIDTFRALKPRWNATIACQIHRCQDLAVADKSRFRRLWINLSRRGWRKKEPLDDATVAERPNLIRQSIEMLVKEGVKSKEQLVADLSLSASDIEKLSELPQGFLSGQVDEEGGPKLKPSQNKVLRFSR